MLVLGVSLANAATAHAAYGDPKFHPDSYIQGIADQWASAYAEPGRIGRAINAISLGGATPIHWLIVAGREDGELPAGPLGPSGADSYPVNSPTDAAQYNDDGPYCRVRVAQSTWQGPAEVMSLEIAHEVFHCYEFALARGSAHEANWIKEGLANWAALSVDPQPASSGAYTGLDDYFAHPDRSLFSRSYDAAVFWDHVADIVGLWPNVQTILSASGNAAEYAAAVSGSESFFLESWGSSVFNHSSPTVTDWAMQSPAIPQRADLQAKPTAIHNSTMVGADAYSTAQYEIDPGPGPLVEVTIPSGALLSAVHDYRNLDGAWYCLQTKPCVCPAGDTGSPPPSTMLVPGPDSYLGIGAGPDRNVGTVTYHSLSEYCTPMTKNGGNNGGMQASSGGDPHFVDFEGDLFDFQAAGQYTLLESTTDDLQIQVRQHEIGHTGVAVNTEIAMRDAEATVEVDATGIGRIAAYVNRHRVGDGNHSLKGGGSLAVSGNDATARWPDGTIVKLQNSVNGPSFSHLVAALWADITVAPDRLGHLTGLLGDAGVPAQSEFASRAGTVYPASAIVGTNTQLLYGAFGQSWRITSKRASLFRSTRPGDLHALSLKGSDGAFAALAALIKKDLGKFDKAQKVCAKHDFANGDAQEACELDVAETGNAGFVQADAMLDQAETRDVAAIVAPPPPPPPAPPAPPTAPTAPALPAPIALGAGSSQAKVAYDAVSGDTYVTWTADNGLGVYVCTLLSGATACHGGPQLLSDAIGGTATSYADPQVVVLGGAPVVLAYSQGATAAVEPAGYSNPEGVIAWSAPAAGGTFAVDNGGKLVSETVGYMPGAGAVALGSSGYIAEAGNSAPFGNGVTDFKLATPAPVTIPTIDSTSDFGDVLDTTGSQFAIIPDAGSYLAVAVGDDSGDPTGCPSGTSYASGYGAAVRTTATLATTSWGSSYFKPLDCTAEAPVLAGGASGIGILEDEGTGLVSTGSDGVYYRAFNSGTLTFGSPVLVSDETLNTLDGADALSLSQDSNGGIYASWTDSRGVVVSYSSNAGTSWTTPFATGLGVSSAASDPVVAGIGAATAAVAYVAGNEEQLQIIPAADINFVP
jgi:hypothetical protein